MEDTGDYDQCLQARIVQSTDREHKCGSHLKDMAIIHPCLHQCQPTAGRCKVIQWP